MAYDVTEERLKVKGSEQITRDLKVNRDAFINGKAETGSIDDKGDLKVAGEILAGDDVTISGALDVQGKIIARNDLHIKGDLSVDGIGEEIISTELKVGANTITLRNDNPTALGNTELAGVVTENYDGNNHNSIIAINKNGVVRVGDIDIATRILYSNDGTNFYTDEDLTIPATIGATEEVRDTGNQTSGGVEIYEGITYSNNDTQPLLTRAESNTFTNGHYLKWDANNKRAVDGGVAIDMFYPIGSIYWTGKAPDDGGDPNVLFGGTWVQIKDRFVWAKGDSDTLNATGGAKTVTLTTSQIPSHNHSFTPVGSVSVTTNPTFTGSEHSHTYTPKGSVSVTTNPTFTGSEVTSYGISTETVTITDPGHKHRLVYGLRNYGTGNLGGGVGTGDTADSDAFRTDVKTTGITAKHPHTHKVTASGSISGGAYKFTGTQATLKATAGGSVSGGAYKFTGTAGTTGDIGDGTAHENMPPYVVKYCWERTA